MCVITHRVLSINKTGSIFSQLFIDFYLVKNSALRKYTGVWGAFAAELLRRYGYPKAIQQRVIELRSALHQGVVVNLEIVRMVYDRLHVIQNGVYGCDQVQKAKIRGDARRRELLERIRWMWRKNPVNSTEKEAQRWESMALTRHMAGMACERMLGRPGIYDWKAAGAAKKPHLTQAPPR